MTIKSGGEVEFTPEKGKVRKGTVEKVSRSRGLAKVKLDGDPFAVTVNLDQIKSCEATGNNVGSSAKVRKGRTTPSTKEESKSMTTTRTSAKELKRKAQSLGIEGWGDMGRAELTKAIKKAEAGESKSKPASSTRKRRTSSKPATKPKGRKPATKKASTAKKASAARKAPAKKAAAKSTPKATKAEAEYTDSPKGVKAPAEAENPFRKGSNLHVIFPLLVPRGGKRRTLAERLAKKVDLHPYSGKDEEVDVLHYDKRLLLCAQTLRDKHGYSIERKGRGLDGTIRVFIPGSESDPRVSANGKPAGKSKGTSRKKSTRKS